MSPSVKPNFDSGHAACAVSSRMHGALDRHGAGCRGRGYAASQRRCGIHLPACSRVAATAVLDAGSKMRPRAGALCFVVSLHGILCWCTHALSPNLSRSRCSRRFHLRAWHFGGIPRPGLAARLV